MIEKHTFKALLETVLRIEAGMRNLEDALNIHFEEGWLVETSNQIINAVINGFFPADKVDDFLADNINELVYHFIYMEDGGNNSKHCKSELVLVNKDMLDERRLSCTNLDELYDVICTFINEKDSKFSFNYCHSYKEDELEKETASKKQKRFTGKYDEHNDPIYEGDILETKYGRWCKVIWFDSPSFSGWDLVPFAYLERQAPDKHDLWSSHNLTIIDHEVN